MKTKIIFFSLLYLVSLGTYSQTVNSIGAFMALPVGKFKSTDVKEGGFAKNGWGIVFDSKSFFKGLPKGLSLYSHTTYQWNEMDTKKMAEEFTKELGYKTEISDSKYSPLLTTAGPAYDFTISKKLSMGINGSAGIIFNNTKAFSVKVYDETNKVIVNEVFNFEGNVAFAYSFGAELRLNIVPDLFDLALYGDYTGANQKTDISSQNSASEAFQKLQYFNVGLKLVIHKQDSK